MSRALTVVSDPVKAGLDWLSTVDDIVVVCRVRHNWPRIVPGQPLPKGFRARPAGSGCVEMIETCLGGCGVERRLVTRPRAMWDEDAHYTYVYPDGYHAPKGSELTQRDARRESFRRTREEIVAMSRRPETVVPTAVFQAG